MRRALLIFALVGLAACQGATIDSPADADALDASDDSAEAGPAVCPGQPFYECVDGGRSHPACCPPSYDQAKTCQTWGLFVTGVSFWQCDRFQVVWKAWPDETAFCFYDATSGALVAQGEFDPKAPTTLDCIAGATDVVIPNRCAREGTQEGFLHCATQGLDASIE